MLPTTEYKIAAKTPNINRLNRKIVRVVSPATCAYCLLNVKNKIGKIKYDKIKVICVIPSVIERISAKKMA